MALPNLSKLRALAALLACLSDASFGYLTRGANGTGASLAGALPYTDAGGQNNDSGLKAVQMMCEMLSVYVLLKLEREQDCVDHTQDRRPQDSAIFIVYLRPYISSAMR